MTENPAIATQGAGGDTPGLHRRHYGAFGFAFVVMLAHLGLLGWPGIEAAQPYPGAVPDALQPGLPMGLQTGLHVAIAVMLTVLSSVLPYRGLRYLGAAFALLVVGESAAVLVPDNEFARVVCMWLYAPIVALAVIVNRRGERVISIWLFALLAVQALAWSGRYAPGTWGMQLAWFSCLAAELALLNAIMRSTVQYLRTQMHANRHLQVLANTDSLTGLYNRRYLDAEIERACQRARRQGNWLSVLMIDIDHFKLFNDTYGHSQGDECLRRVAAVLQQRQQRCDDAACRYGGEEFAMILPACDLDAAHCLASLLCKDVRALDVDHARSAPGRVTVSIGIASVQITGDERGTDLLRLADEALYAAKRAGRDTIGLPATGRNFWKRAQQH